jgi:N-acyl-D-aspartate/D-glutamate deacylase
VMGERGADHDEVPTAEEITRMGRLAREGIAAGALGFTTSRTVNQKAADGRFTPSLTATRDELVGIASELGLGGKGVLGAVADFVDVDAEFALLYAMSEVSGLPLSISTMQTDARPQGWRRLLELMSERADQGARVRGQVATRAIGVLLGVTSTINPFLHVRGMQELAELPVDQRLIRLQQPDVRAAILAEADSVPPIFDWGRVYQLGDPPDYDPPRDASLAARAAASVMSPAALAYELMLSNDGRELLYMPFNNWVDHNLDVVREMLAHPYTVPGLGDAGAHCGLICDASFPTFLLTYWARDRKFDQLPIEYLVKRQTKDTAELVGLNDRGVLRPGYKADANVINMADLQIGRPMAVYDLPADGRRLVQHATGYVATVVAGEIVMRAGEHTGALPGRLVRGAREVSAEGC